MILQFRGKYSRRARHVVPAHLVQDPIRILPIKIYTRRISRLGSGHRYAPISEAFSSRKCHRVGLAASSSGKFWKWSPANCSFTQDRAPDRSSRCCMPCPTRYTISGAETCQDFIEKKDWSLKLGGRGGGGRYGALLLSPLPFFLSRASSQGLNLLDYFVWGCRQQMVGSRKRRINFKESAPGLSVLSARES